MAAIKHFTDLIAYQKRFEVGREVFKISRTWPAEERFSLTDQARRSSRSIGANIAESWGKRRYKAHFVSKLTDADTERFETEHWLLCAKDHGYIDQATFNRLLDLLSEVGRLLGGIMQNPDSFLLPPGDEQPRR
jgi:four helix bundle protein